MSRRLLSPGSGLPCVLGGKPALPVMLARRAVPQPDQFPLLEPRLRGMAPLRVRERFRWPTHAGIVGADVECPAGVEHQWRLVDSAVQVAANLDRVWLNHHPPPANCPAAWRRTTGRTGCGRRN